MATQDQTIEIKVSLRDEISKAAEQAVAKLLRLNQVDTSRSQHAFNTLGRAASFAGREIRSLAAISGVGGILGAGGIIAGLVAAKRSLDEFAQSGMRLHFTARELRVSETSLRDFTDAMRAVGQSEGEAASGIQGALRTLEEAWTEGRGSRMFKELEKGVGDTGTKLFRDLMQSYGREGPDKALELALKRMEGMNPRAQASFMRIMGFGTVGATELRKILPQLVPVIRMSKDEMLKYNIANVNLERTWGNIKTTIGSALLPAFTELTKAVDEYLRSPAGQKFLQDIKGWISSMAESIRGPGFAKQLNSIIEGSEQVVKDLAAAFKVADETVQAMGTSWPKVFEVLVATKIVGWLLGFGNALRLIIPLLPALAAAKDVLSGPWTREEFDKAIKEKTEQAPQTLEQGKQEIKEWLEWIWRSMKGGPWRGERHGALAPAGQEKGMVEKLAEAAAVRLTNADLKDKLGRLDDELGELTGHLQVGGPGDGYQFGGGSQEWQSTPLPAGSFAARARMEKWADWKAFQRSSTPPPRPPGSAEWENAEAPPGYGPGGNLPRPGGIQQYLREYDPGSAPDWLMGVTPPIERPAGLTAGAGGGGVGARGRLPWEAPTLPQLSPIIAPRFRGYRPRGLQSLGGGGVAGLLGGGGMDGFDMPLPGWETSRLNRNVAAAEGFKGSGQVDIDIGNVAASPDASNPSTLFRPLILEKTPQMAASGSDRSVPSNFNQA